eukprot:5146396-Prymnesium_polylepis.2
MVWRGAPISPRRRPRTAGTEVGGFVRAAGARGGGRREGASALHGPQNYHPVAHLISRRRGSI